MIGRKTKRLVLSLTAAGAALVFSSTVALAAISIGTDNSETVAGTDGNDQINGKGGDDRLLGRAGNDTYYFADGFGVDTLVDTAGTDAMSFSTLSTGVNAYLIPEWGDAWNAVYDTDDETVRVYLSTTTRDSLIEQFTGGLGEDYVASGGANNTLRPGGGADDELRDYGGYGGGGMYDPIPKSDDTYRSFASNTGTDRVTDYGGSADVLDLRPFESTDVYVDRVDAVEDDNDTTEQSLRLVTGKNAEGEDIEVIIVGYFTNRYKIEEIRFADDTISTAQTQDLAAASAREGSNNVTAKDLATEAR
jgi:Ca2+-binding RTX toxin-like protein